MDIMSVFEKVTTSIRDWVDANKVQKVSGKGLSTNDYTIADKNKVASMPNDLVILGGKLYLAQDGEPLTDSAVTLPEGGGGGSSATITITNLLESNTLTAAIGQAVNLKFDFVSSETDQDGTAYIYVNDVLKMSTPISSGENTIDISSCVAEGINSIKLTCMDIYSNSKSLAYSVDIVALKLMSQFDSTIPYSGDISYTYTPVINATKEMHFIVDGLEVATEEVTTSGRQQTYVIPCQKHGSHSFEVYFTVNLNGEIVQSNHLYYDLICVEDGATIPIISCVYNNTIVEQFETLVIQYIVYSPTSLISNVTLSANGNTVSELTVDRTMQKWSFRADEYGELTLDISCGGIRKTLNIDVTKSEIDVVATTGDLELYLSADGRNNNESNPAQWSYDDITCSFHNYNWASDGWLIDDDGIAVHRVAGDARLTIPLQIFASDFRSSGKTLEFEIATREVLNYDTTVLSCYSGGRGFVITAQQLLMASEQSSLGTRYKENEHIRISIVIEKKTENRLLLCYINGIMSGAAQYPVDDDFSQTLPVGITIGSNECTIDLYNIRIYKNNLTRYQILDNWIADTQDVSERIDRFKRNEIYDAYGNVVMSQLPNDLPYLVLRAASLPQYKGDKKSCSGYFVDPLDSSRNFSFTNAQIDVQGTSSQYYYVKNYKIKYKNGFILLDGTEVDDYKMNENAIPVNTFTMKADVASSEGAFNVVLAMLYDDLCPYKTPAQVEDPRVRQTIEGFPIVIFWDNGVETKFVGKYNFNNDKGTETVFGFQDGDESWEIRQNGTDRVGWHSADFSGDDWKNDFEARYPEDNIDTTRLQALAEWLVSTDVGQATNAAITPITYKGVEYTSDTAEYRLAKFDAELSNHFIEEAIIYYYLFTEIFLCIDQREKNAFPTYIESLDRWIVLFYDADSSCGTDNKGNLSFDPYLEDIDYTEGGDPIYNGQNSVLWNNLKATRYSKIMEMYQQMRVDGLISYENVSGRFEEHQSKWPEAIFNEDMYRKCIEPLVNDGDGMYLPMLQGKKEQWIKWWLYNRFRYIDTKYLTGTSETNKMIIRVKSKANIKLTSYINMYGHVYYNSEMVEHRMERGKEYEFVWAASGAEDAVIGINDADMLTSLGDLSEHMVEQIDTSLATHITSLKLGDSSEDYANYSLKSLTLGNNKLLRTLDVSNCRNLTQSVDISGCTNIEHVYFDGSAITGINLPNGGILKTLHLPDTITNLTIRNQASLTDFVLNDSSNLTTLRLENVGALIDAPSVILSMPEGGRIRALDIDWLVNSEEELVILLNKLVKMRGLDEGGNNMPSAILSGRIRVNEKVSDDVVGEFYNHFVDVVIDDGTEELYILNYKDRDGTILYSVRVGDGANAIDPIEAGYIEAPAPIITDTYRYEFLQWSDLPKNINRHHIIIAQYHTKFAIHFYSEDELVHTQWSVQGDAAEDPVASGVIAAPVKPGTADTSYKFSSWDNLPANVQASTSVYAQYDTYWAARFWNDNTLYLTEWIISGGTVADPEEYFEDYIDPTRESTAQYDYRFSRWDGDFDTVMTSAREFYATYTSTIRRYNVYFYNDTQLLQTKENIQYGSSTSYTGATPTKLDVDNPEEYVFKGWMPAPDNITGETYCYALFKFTGYLFGKLADEGEEDYGWGTVDSPNWSEINAYWTTIAGDINAYKSGTMSRDDLITKYPIGGRMIIPIELSGGAAVADVEIIAHEHDDLADGTGKSPITFFCADLPRIQHIMNESEIGNVGGWKDSAMREFVNGELFNALPEELRTIIKPVLKISDGGNTKTLVTTTDNCWLASYDEVGFTNSEFGLLGQGTLYSDIFSSANSSRAKTITDNTTTGGWWLRSAYFGGSSNSLFIQVTRSGSSYGYFAYVELYVAFGFCI